MKHCAAILFDLDGTLLDTAPDMVGALNRLRGEEGAPPLEFADVRPHVSHGAARLVALGFPAARDAEFERLRRRFLDLYRAGLATATQLFPGMAPVLDELERRALPWGVVTNKPAWLTDPLLDALGLAARAACVVSGDTVAERKPHPLPLLHAADLVGALPARCVYVGDAERDIQAGRAAGMSTLVAAYGYLGAGEDYAAWLATGAIGTPRELVDWLDARDAARAVAT